MSGPTSFRYDGYELVERGARVAIRCRYSLGEHRFTEEVRLDGPSPASGAVDAAARLVHLLAGVSYYKTAAPPVIDLGDVATTSAERAFLRTFYRSGLAEFAYRNGLDLSGLRIVGPDAGQRVPVASGCEGPPLVPFGAGIDSIVTVEHVRRTHPDVSLFVVSRGEQRFPVIERAAAATGLPVVRAERRIDPAVLDSASAGFLEGHVPVTGILSAIAVVAAVLGGHGAVVMSNERSASAPTLEHDGSPVNHQWSKGLEFEDGFRSLLAATIDRPPDYFSYLRARSELWVARELAALGAYHAVFRSCNRAFHTDPARRLDDWCGECDKCCFIDLVLAPFLSAGELAGIFGGREPLCSVAQEPKLRGLAGTGPSPRPFECVGDEEECRVAVLLAARRGDRATCATLQRVAAEVRLADPALARDLDARAARLFGAVGPDFVPSGFRAEAAHPDARPTDGGRATRTRTPVPR